MQIKPKVIESNFNLINVYNPVANNLENVLHNNVHIIYGHLDMKKVFPVGTISVT